MRWSHLATTILAGHGLATRSAAAPSASGLPMVTLDQGTFTGVADGLANKFLGIPFAQPPLVTNLTLSNFTLMTFPVLAISASVFLLQMNRTEATMMQPPSGSLALSKTLHCPRFLPVFFQTLPGFYSMAPVPQSLPEKIVSCCRARYI